MEIINFPLLKNPVNWIYVTIMVIFFGIAAHLILDFYNLSPGPKAS